MTEQEKKDKIREQNRKAVKKYREKTVSFAIKYSAVDSSEGKRLKLYLAQAGQSANAYIKKLIKNDLDEKGFMIDMVDTMEQVNHVSGSDNNDKIS